MNIYSLFKGHYPINLFIKHCLANVILITIALISSPLAQATTDTQGVLQGVKEDQQHQPFVSPGATLSIRIPPANNKQTFGPEITSYQTSLNSGAYEIGMQAPDGYQVYYSLCNNCKNHPQESYHPYGNYNSQPLIINILPNQYVDLNWQFLPINYVQVPMTSSSGTFINQTLPGTPRSDISQKLSCNIPGSLPQATQPTDSQLFKGTHAWAEVGIHRDIGAIGVAFSLINPDFPETPLQIIEARSSGGAAWQSTIGLTSIINTAAGHSQPVVHYNQAAGNSAQVWGFGSTINSGTDIGLVQKNWLPLFSTEVKPAIGSSIFTPTSPCYHSGTRFGEGLSSIVPSYSKVGNSKVLRLTSTYLFRALNDQSWATGDTEQALYLLRSVARSADLRIYFAGANDKTILGPLRPYEPFPSPSFSKDQIFQLNCPNTDPSASCFMKTLPSSYAVLVWKVKDQDIAIAIHATRRINDNIANHFTGVINLRQALSCKDPSNDDCGNVQWHTVINLPEQQTLRNGEMIELAVNYDIGTVAEIDALGFHIKSPENEQDKSKTK